MIEAARKYEVDPDNEKSKNQPLAILYLYKILYELTDEDNGLTSNQIIELLKNDNIILRRQAVSRYINLLKDILGADILLPGNGSRDGYRMCGREFSLVDVKVLADAVVSARFITEETASELLDKLGNLVSKRQKAELRRNVYVAGRVKSKNESVTNLIDWIHHAISEKKMIAFDYYEYDVSKQMKMRGERRECTPYALVWSDDRYYLVASHPKYGIANFRVDRMKNIGILEDKPAEPIPKEYQDFNGKRFSFNLSKYMKSTFSMFSGSDTDVTLRFDKSLVSVVLDKFGYETHIVADDDGEHFKVNVGVKAEHPEAFFGWLFQFGKRAEILSPANIKQQYVEMLQGVLESSR